MQEGRRSNIQIAAEIINIARHGARKTQIVYGANLNFKILQEYLKDLKEQGLVEIEGNFIRATDKGKEYVKQVRGLREFGLITVHLHW